MKYDTETTEKLLDSKSVSNPNKKKLPVLLIIVGVVAVILLAYLGYSWYKNATYKKLIEEGYSLIKSKDFATATVKFDEAIELFTDKEEAYAGYAEASFRAGDYSNAVSAYQSLGERTGKTDFYDYIAKQFNFGNSNANISNGGFIVKVGQTGYLAENSDDMYKLWQIKNGKDAELNYTASSSATATTTISNLCMWKNRLYSLQNRTINYDDQDLGRNVETEITDAKCFNIYKDKLYYIADYNVSTFMPAGVYTCDLNGNGITPAFTIQGVSVQIRKIVFDDDNLYTVVHFNEANQERIFKTPIGTQNTEELIRIDGNYIDSTVCVNGKLYYSLVSSNDSTFTYGGIYSLDLETKEKQEITSPGDIHSVNSDGSSLFYISGTVIYKSDLTGNGQTQIGEVPELNPADGNIVDSQLGVTNSNLYATSSLVFNPLYKSYGFQGKFLTASLSDPGKLSELTYDSTRIDNMQKIQTEKDQ